MLKKIISGGQTGADQGALDAAVFKGISHGGWIPKGRITENGPLPDKYNLQEMPTTSYAARTEKNVIDSDGTLILSHGRLTGDSKLTQRSAIRHNRPCLHIDLYTTSAFEAYLIIALWIKRENIEILNIAGPRASKDSEIYQKTKDIIESVCLLTIEVESYRDKYMDPPKSVDEAVDRLIPDLVLKDKVDIANMTEEQVEWLHISLRNYIRGIFRLWTENESLMKSCRMKSGIKDLRSDRASEIIIEALWERLRDTHKLHVVK